MTLELGEIRIDLVSDGTFRLDGGAMFGVVPKPLWERVKPADERNRITLALNCLLVRTSDEVVLVDTGIGNSWSDKERGIYAIDHGVGLLGRLAELGVRPEEVTRVVNTHLHFDHAGGNTLMEDGVARPAFPNAEYVVQRGEFEWAMSPTLRDRASYHRNCFAPLQEMGCLRLVKGEAEVVPGVRVRPLPGHTPNLQGILIEGAGETVFFPSDLVPTASHVPYPWVMGYDLEPLVTLRTKMTVFPEAARAGWLVVLQHEPDNPVGRIRIQDDSPVLDPVSRMT